MYGPPRKETPHPRATDARSRGIKFPISSGVNYGLLAWAVLARLAASPRRVAACYAALLAALAAKVLLDIATPGLVPNVGLPKGIALAGLAHVAGFYAAVLIWILYKLPCHPVKRPTARRPIPDAVGIVDLSRSDGVAAGRAPFPLAPKQSTLDNTTSGTHKPCPMQTSWGRTLEENRAVCFGPAK